MFWCSKYKPSGDQPAAIAGLSQGVKDNVKHQVCLGVTGSGKTFTMANIIEQTQRPALILAHNKTLAAQLCSEFKEFFPHNAVEFFVSYYDYYQPEAYIEKRDLYIEKDSSMNEEIDRMRHSATSALLERRDVIVVASVSCIYGIGDPDDYKNATVSLRTGMTLDRDELIDKLVSINFTRGDIEFTRGTFRVRGDIVEVFPMGMADKATRIEFFGDEIDRILEVDVLTGKPLLAGQLYHDLPRHPLCRGPGKGAEQPCPRSRRIWWPRPSSSRPRASSLRPSGFCSGLPMTWKC